MNAREIRAWLLCQPRPSLLRITTEDDQAHELQIPPGASWIATAQSVEALQPVLIQAYDGANKLLRAIRPQEQQPETEDSSSSSSSSSAPTPPTTTAAGDVQMFARLLADAYRHSTEVSFARMVDLFEAVNRRSEALERSLDSMQRMLRRAWEDQIAAQADAAQAQAEANSDPLGGIVNAFVGGVMNGTNHSAASNGAASKPTNGAAK